MAAVVVAVAVGVLCSHFMVMMVVVRKMMRLLLWRLLTCCRRRLLELRPDVYPISPL
jgi:hypothetical protein